MPCLPGRRVGPTAVVPSAARQRRPILGPLRTAMRSWATHGAAAKPPQPPQFSEAELQIWAPADDGLLPPHLRLGVSFNYLRAFCDAANIRPWDATHKVADIVIRKTAKSRRSFAEDLLESGARASDVWPAVAAATLYVIHAHECSWVHMLDAIEDRLLASGADPAAAYLWLDVVCVRHHRVREDLAQVGRAQRLIGAACVVLDPPSAPACLSRQWALYEIAQAALADGVALTLAFGPPPTPEGSRAAAPQLDEEPSAEAHAEPRPDAAPPLDQAAFAALLPARLAAGRAREASAGVDKERDAIVGHVTRAFGGAGADDERTAFVRYGELVCFALEREFAHASFASARDVGRLVRSTSSCNACPPSTLHTAPNSARGSARSLSIDESNQSGACQVARADESRSVARPGGLATPR